MEFINKTVGLPVIKVGTHRFQKSEPNLRIGIYCKLCDFPSSVFLDFRLRRSLHKTVMKNTTLLHSHTLLSRGITSVCFAVVFLKLWSHSSLPRCCKFSPAVDARWEHVAKTRFCHNLMGPYFQAVLYLASILFMHITTAKITGVSKTKT